MKELALIVVVLVLAAVAAVLVKRRNERLRIRARFEDKMEKRRNELDAIAAENAARTPEERADRAEQFRERLRRQRQANVHAIQARREEVQEARLGESGGR